MNKIKFVIFALIVLFIVDVSMFIIFLKGLDKNGTNDGSQLSNTIEQSSVPIVINIKQGELMIIEKKDDLK